VIKRRNQFLMPSAKNADGKVHGALPRILARGTPPETPAAFPFCPIFQNGPRRQGFASPRTNSAPLSAPGRSERLPITRERRQMPTQNLSQFAALFDLPLVGPELLNQFGVDKTS
jgi:hypothetical protein